MINKSDFKLKKEDYKSTRKLYRMWCDSCGADRGYQRRSRHGTGMCKSCASSFVHKSKRVSHETREKMKQNHFLNNGGEHPLKGKRHSDNTISKLSRAATKQNKRYKRSDYVYEGVNGRINMRSSWEVKYAEWLDHNGISWSYEPEFELSDGRVYTPDFKLEDGTIIEIKGYFREDAREKWNMFSEDYPELNKSLLMKGELKELGVL